MIHDGADVQPIVLKTDGDQRPPGDERGEFAGGQLTRIGIQPRAVGGQEEVAPVAVHLGPLVLCTASSTASGCSPNSSLRTARSSRSGSRRSSQRVTDSSGR